MTTIDVFMILPSYSRWLKLGEQGAAFWPVSMSVRKIGKIGGVAECPGHGVGIAAGRDDGVACGERRLHDVNAHSTASTSHEPHFFVRYGISRRWG
jgi:hypothetical protein